MSTTDKKEITVETTVKSPIEKVWRFWTDPKHIVNWYNASHDWHAPYADNNLQLNGRFKTTMAAKDGSMSFDFEGIYTNIVEYKLIEYEIVDGRKVKITFSNQGEEIKVMETFEMENINSLEVQKSGWQSILNNFKKYIESNP